MIRVPTLRIRRSTTVVTLALLALVTMSMSCNSAGPPAATSQAGQAPAAGAPVTGPRAYVTNEVSGDVTVIDLVSQSVVATIPLGKRPRGIQLSPDRTKFYVALSGSPIAGPGVDESKLPPADKGADGIGVFDLKQGKLVTVLHSGSDPETVAVSHDGKQLFIANEDTAQLTVIDPADGRVLETIKVGGEPEGTGITPDGKRVYVTSEDDGAVFVVDTDTHKLVGSVKVGPRPRSVVFLPKRLARVRALGKRCDDFGGRHSRVEGRRHHPPG